MFFQYPYSTLYNLNLDWIIKAIKEVQDIVAPLDRVVNSVNGMTGDVEITKALLTQILGNLVETFNGRTGNVELTAEDVNATLIDITWTSDPGDTIDDLTQTEIDQLFINGKRVLIFVNNLGVADQVYFLQYYDGHAQPQLYSPTAALAGVSSFNGRTGAIIATGSNLPTSNNDQTPIAETLTAQSDSISALGPYNGLDSDSTTEALSAAQGKALAEDIDDLGTELNSQSQQIGTLDTRLDNTVLKGQTHILSKDGTLNNTITLVGLTADHVVANWGLSVGSVSNPPADINITEAANAYTVVVSNVSVDFEFTPTFVLPQNLT